MWDGVRRPAPVSVATVEATPPEPPAAYVSHSPSGRLVECRTGGRPALLAGASTSGASPWKSEQTASPEQGVARPPENFAVIQRRRRVSILSGKVTQLWAGGFKEADMAGIAGGRTERGALRIFVIDKVSSRPVTGAPVSVSVAGSPAKDAQAAQPRFVASLQTDQAGYVSFKFDRSQLGDRAELVVAVVGSDHDPLTLSADRMFPGSTAHTILVDASDPGLGAPRPASAAVMLPDALDATLSPASVGLIPQLRPDYGLCAQLLPTTLSIKRFDAFHLFADICNPEDIFCTELGSGRGAPLKIVRGKILEYRVSWIPVGTCLGDLLNTISLAPCEQVNVAVVDWMRRDMAVLEQTADVRQHTLQQTNHDTLIAETMASSVKNKALAFGMAHASQASGKIPLGKLPIKLDMTGSFGAGVSGTSSTQNTAVRTTRQMADRITQEATFVSSQRNSAVFQTTANESQTYQTRTVRNNNHCHTLTLAYYQVNRNYRVVTEYLGEREVILVHYEVTDFDALRAYCNADALKEALLEPGLEGAFDDLAEALFCCDASSTNAADGPRMDAITISFKVLSVFHLHEVTVHLVTANGTIALQPPLQGPFQAGQDYTFTLTLAGQIPPSDLSAVVLWPHFLSISPHHLLLDELSVTYHAVGYPQPYGLYSSHDPQLLSGPKTLDVQPELPPTDPSHNSCVAASCSVQKLLGHLNCHRHYYNTAVWLAEDPNHRVNRWSCCGRAEQPFSLIGAIANTPLTVYGDYVVFPTAGGELVDDPTVAPVEELVTLPTPGVFSEGMLGQCNTCEAIDPDTFWNWKDSPCADQAPAAPTAPHGDVLKPSDLNLKADTISSLISLTSVPTVSDSILKDLFTTLITNADGGSKEAKELLDKLLDTIKISVGKSD
jgi:hypothetical protein